jgi:putative DNA primase/helicase
VRDQLTPSRFSHYSENIPDELKTGAPAWVCCDEVKVPLVAVTSGACYAASSTDPSTWRDYDTAFTSWRENEWSFAGIGRVIKADEDLVGVDLDKCLDPQTRELTPWASTILERLGSYAEISPSGMGVKIWVRAPSVTRAHVKPGLEIYPRGRYFTVTGLTLGGTTDVIEERGDQLEGINRRRVPEGR